MADSNQSDHDLLIRIAERVDTIDTRQVEFIRTYESRHTTLVGRVSALEAKDRGDSEKTRAISVDVQRTLANHERIGSLETKISAIETIVAVNKEEISHLRSRSGWLDFLNALLAAAAAAIGYFVGR